MFDRKIERFEGNEFERKCFLIESFIESFSMRMVKKNDQAFFECGFRSSIEIAKFEATNCAKYNIYLLINMKKQKI